MKLRTYPFALNRSMSAGISSADRFVFGPGEFKGDTGIAVYKCDVSSYDACVAGLSKIEKDLGPVEVLVSGACYLTGQKNSQPTLNFSRTLSTPHRPASAGRACRQACWLEAGDARLQGDLDQR
jgi:NAD(P)-dependent dehydrogenase (short-subunit alcohol dehydrogenase family)